MAGDVKLNPPVAELCDVGVADEHGRTLLVDFPKFDVDVARCGGGSKVLALDVND